MEHKVHLDHLRAENDGHLPEVPSYDYLNKRGKPYPWGMNSLFFNPHVCLSTNPSWLLLNNAVVQQRSVCRVNKVPITRIDNCVLPVLGVHKRIYGGTVVPKQHLCELHVVYPIQNIHKHKSTYKHDDVVFTSCASAVVL